MAYVYVYYDTSKTPIEPIYVGKGVNNRWKEHLRKTNKLLTEKLTFLKNLGLDPLIEKIKDNISDDEAYKLEVELISKYGKICDNTGTLCNFTDGGRGDRKGFKHSEETKKLFSEQRKGKKQTEKQYLANCNRKHTEEAKKKMSESNKGIDRLSKETRDRVRKLNTGKVRSEETKKLFSEQRKGKKQTEKQYLANCNRNCKKVYCITNNTTYKSVKETAQMLNLKTYSIRSVLNSQTNSTKGYKFKYVEN